MSTPNDTALDYARSLAASRFWGFLTLKFEDGRVVHIRKEENLKPSELPEKTRGEKNDCTRL